MKEEKSKGRNPKIGRVEIIKRIAKTTGMTKQQVENVFVCYADFVVNATNYSFMENKTIDIPFLGGLSIKRRKGKKKGESVFSNRDFITGQGVTKILEEDRPDSFYLRFKPSIKLKETLKENCIKVDNQNVDEEEE